MSICHCGVQTQLSSGFPAVFSYFGSAGAEPGAGGSCL